MKGLVERDERTIALENASYRWAYLFVSFGLLVATAYRSFARHEASWDLFALIVAGGVVSTGYQVAQRSLPRRWWVPAAVAFVAAIVTAALVAFARR
jgi:hypothetical protein